jgi:EmrB/QacA subfamily drug resistance transporter
MTLSLSIGFVDQTALNVALPSIQRDFDATSTSVEWAVTAFLLTAAATVAAAGRIADILGRRRVYLFGTVLFGASSMLCGLAVTTWWLIAARGLQGVAAAMMGPSAVAIISTSFPPERLGRALGTIASAAAVALCIGPLVGGLITEDLGWQWIFFVNVPIVAVVVVLVRAFANESQSEDHRAHIDVPGLILLTVGLTTLILGLSQIPEWGLATPTAIALFSTAAVSFVTLAVVERRVEDPLLHLEVLRHRHVVAAGTVGFCFQFVMIGFNLFGMIYFQTIFGLSPIDAGLLFLPAVVPQVVVPRLAGHLADAIGPTVPVVVGMATIGAALAWVSFVAEQPRYLAMVPALVAFGIGIALVITPAKRAQQAAVAHEHRGLAEGVVSTINRIGSALGVAVIGAVILTLQKSRTLDLLGQAGVRPDGPERASLDRVVVQTHSSARALQSEPRQVSGAIEHAAHSAYTFGFATSMRAGAVIVVIGGLVALVLLRQRKPALSSNVEADVASGLVLAPEATEQ